MHIHISGICGTFMGGIAQIARVAGHHVTGSDAQVYPPMDGQLRAAGIDLMEGYSARNLEKTPDLLIIGNALSRGNEEVEYALDKGIRYISGAQWLSENVLQGKWILAVAGTHGKTTTSSMIAWILEYAGMQPGFLIGGVPRNFEVSARSSESAFFVVEADEYDTAFFDKRSKFVHYRPRSVVLNNLEFDHSDIFDSIDDIVRQFHHLLRTIPRSGKIVFNAHDSNIERVISMGCWSELESFVPARIATGSESPTGWIYNSKSTTLSAPEGQLHTMDCGLCGEHSFANATAAIAACRHAGVPVNVSIAAMREFKGVARRQDLLDTVGGVQVYDDFAHHPTEIAATLQALRTLLSAGSKLIAVVDFRSNSMVAGTHLESTAAALTLADEAVLYNAQPDKLDLSGIVKDVEPTGKAVEIHTIDDAVSQLSRIVASGDIVVCMSNGSFGGIHAKILTMLRS